MWDFGGHPDLYTSHQLFLTGRCLSVIVLDLRQVDFCSFSEFYSYTYSYACSYSYSFSYLDFWSYFCS